jgi:uncharacterized protein (TIGR03118 family)
MRVTDNVQEFFKMNLHRKISNRAALAVTTCSACLALLAACGGGAGHGAAPAAVGFTDTALVSSSATATASAKTIDANLQNPWGIAIGPNMPFWISDNNNNLSTLYSGIGGNETQTITGSNNMGIAIPESAAGSAASPTGQIYNGSGGFTIPTTRGQEPALFIFDGQGGTIAAWATDSGATAFTAYDDTVANGVDHAVYKGLAIGTGAGAGLLFATDFHNNKVDVFDAHFSKPAAMQGKFVDPDMPAGFAPFGIQTLQGHLFVTFAKQDDTKLEEITGAGLGYVDVFDFSGNLLNRFASAGSLNAPWGVAVAPAGFGSLQGDVLIGNFGDGTINIFSPNGTSPANFEGPLMSTGGQPLAFPALWSLAFGNGDADKPVTTLFYTAGLTKLTDGVLGGITLTSNPTPIGY